MRENIFLRNRLKTIFQVTSYIEIKWDLQCLLANWFRGPLRKRVYEALMGPTLANTGIFNQAFLKEMLDQHQSGRRDYSAPLWTLLMFESFLRNLAPTKII